MIWPKSSASSLLKQGMQFFGKKGTLKKYDEDRKIYKITIPKVS